MVVKNRYASSRIVIVALIITLIGSFPVTGSLQGRSDDGETVEVRQIVFGGEVVFSQEKMLPLVQDCLGKRLTISDLNKQVDLITQYYRQHGYFVAKAYLPNQQIHQGIVKINVLIGHYDRVIVHNQTAISSAVIQNQLKPLHSGKVIELAELERTLWLLEDLPGVKAKATLAPGQFTGTSDLIVDLTKVPTSVETSISIDNGGDRFTGTTQTAADVKIPNVGSNGSLLFLHGVTTGSGLSSGEIEYAFPWGFPGGKITVGYSKLHYVLGDQFADLAAGGTADDVHFGYSYPWVRSRNQNVYGFLTYSQKRMMDELQSLAVHKKSRLWTVGINGDFAEDGWGAGYSLSYSQGQLQVEEDPDPFDRDDQSSGKFGKWNLSYTYRRDVTEQVHWLLSLTGQLATSNLDSSEKIFLGGVHGVRAYPTGEAAGDSGLLATLELHRRWGRNNHWDIFSFVDAGRIKKMVHPFDDGEPNFSSLAAYGLGLIYQGPSGFTMEVSYAEKLTPARALTDRDRHGRLWFRTSMEW